ncbi:MAG: DUF3592 domain-containing protein [Myxococcaceae bacterium]|nr:DUF3592 domain-containing protein [Myxococcaceae bacterium]
MGLILAVVGIGLVVGSIVAASRTKRFLATAQEARAEVIGMHVSSGTQSSRAYFPVLRYRTQKGATHEVTSSVGSNPPRYKEGDSVVILYEPANPTNVRIHTFSNVWLVPMILGGIGGIFILVGGVLAAVMR